MIVYPGPGEDVAVVAQRLLVLAGDNPAAVRFVPEDAAFEVPAALGEQYVSRHVASAEAPPTPAVMPSRAPRGRRGGRRAAPAEESVSSEPAGVSGQAGESVSAEPAGAANADQGEGE